MLKYLALAASLVFGSVAPAIAQVGMPMSYELMSRTDNGYSQDDLFEIRERLVVQIEASLRLDPLGNAYVVGTPCSTPNDFFRAFQEYHPEHAPENVGDLPDFLRTLQLMRAQELGIQGDTYASSRMMCRSAGSSSSEDELDLEGVERAVRLNEFVWVHPNGSIMMLGDCSNIVRAPTLPTPEEPPVSAPPPEEPWYQQCLFVPTGTRRGASYQWAHFLREPIPGSNSQTCRVLCQGVLRNDGTPLLVEDTCIRAPRPCQDCEWGEQPIPSSFEVQDSAQWDAEWDLTMIGISVDDARLGGYFAICGYQDDHERTGVPIFEPDELADAADAGVWNQGIVVPYWNRGPTRQMQAMFRVGDLVYFQDRRGNVEVREDPLDFSRDNE